MCHRNETKTDIVIAESYFGRCFPSLISLVARPVAGCFLRRKLQTDRFTFYHSGRPLGRHFNAIPKNVAYRIGRRCFAVDHLVFSLRRPRARMEQRSRVESQRNVTECRNAPNGRMYVSSMRILDRYIFREILFPSLIALVALTFVAFLAFSREIGWLLEMIVRQSATVRDIWAIST